MSSQAYGERLARALEATGMCEPVKVSYGEGRVAVLCRVKQEKEKQWVDMLKKVLVASEEEAKEVHAWQCHFCKNYFLKGDNMVWGWNVSIQSREMSHSLDKVSLVIKGQPIRVASNREVEEFPLFGAPADRNSPKNGRGVHTIGGKGSDFSPGKK